MEESIFSIVTECKYGKMEAITIGKEEVKSIYFHINLKGRLYYKILNESGTNSIHCWWLKGPFGNREEVGRLLDSGTIDIKGLLWGRLKADGCDSITKVFVTERSEIAALFPSL